MPQDLVLPRPGASYKPQPPVAGPTESAFVEAFGALLPAAQFLQTPRGKAAYYEITPSSSNDGVARIDKVLFIHGVQTPALGMLPLARALEKSFPAAHMVVIDLWGHGLSDTPVAPHESSLFHELIDNLLDHLSWQSTHIVGFSFGGATTVSYVASRPSRVKSFTLVAPAGLLQLSMFPPEEQAYLQGDDYAAAKKCVLNILEGGDLVVPKDWKQRVAKGEVVAEAVREWQMREHPGHTASVVAIFRDGAVMDSHAQFDKAAKTGIPSLAVLGELDTLCNKEQLNDLGFENVFVVPKAVHSVVRDQALDVANLIGDFWRGLEPQ
ncbi:dihydrolipoyllysine-residue acetyltransferase component of acetoin cleaving system [Fusarium subglutinans]|uniref:Dihydrolipoyllysine-residue acetyltransferase component of acetoin cleaving system n=1 Tax=Gibberella subglutinans TaxID=42677 RepID=A0A8H5Q0T1_GIBSU|nr:dihydrolipoyllysine-residue acetyltransferase component of acetoin cleaving system [Fusarium subglutinans]KAF5606504.1 dihydrolipoyllysine-residue acetyltransferase component of acetoin cleaving system [Fusarium subglutinans]